MDKVKENKLAFGGAGILALAAIAWLAFGFFGIQTAFIDNVVAEDGPVFAVTAPVAGSDESATGLVDPEPAEPPTEVAAAPAEAPDEIITTFTGDFGPVNGYDVVGQANVLENGTDQRFLRLENFASPNGPDLKVYLRAANGDFVSLGDLSGNIGDQNYEIPAGVDLNEFSSVEIWCERFSVGFGEATLSAS